MEFTLTQGLLRKSLHEAEKWVKAQNDDGSDVHGRVAIRILFETFERCSTVDHDKVDFPMLEPLVDFMWMMTSVQLEMFEIAAKVMLLEDVPSGSGSVAKRHKTGKEKPDSRTAAMALL